MINYLIELAVVHVALFLGYWFFLRKERQYARMRLYLIASTRSGTGDSTAKLPKLFFFQRGPAGDDAHGSNVQGTDIYGFDLPGCGVHRSRQICLGR